MPRVRFGVVVLVPPSVAHEVDGLRRAFGDPTLDRVPAHLTLVPPINVRVEDVAATLAILRGAASRSGPLELELGPPRRFDTDEGVVYLAVGGDDRSQLALRQLHEASLAGPLDRRLDHPFVPHVTLTTGVAPDRVAGLIEAAADFRQVVVTVDRLHLLQQQAEPPHRWVPVADVPLGPAIIVGRGGLPVELTPSELVDPEALALLASLQPSDNQAGDPVDDLDDLDDRPEGVRPLVVVARRDQAAVGVAQGWTAGPVAELVSVDVVDRQDGTGEHLRSAWWSAAAVRGAS